MTRHQHGWFRSSRRRGDRDHVRFGLTAAGLALWDWDPATDEVGWEGNRFAELRSEGRGHRSLSAYMDTIDPDDRGHVRAALAACATSGEPVEEEFRVVDPGGAPRWLMMRGQLYRPSRGRRPRVIGVTADITDRRQAETERAALLAAESRARADADAAARRMADLQLVTEAGLARLGVDELLQHLLERVREMLAADSATVLLLNDDRGRLAVRASLGIEESLAVGVEIPLGEGISGGVAASRQPAVVDDLSTVDVATSYLRNSGLASLAAVPLVAEDRTIGVLHVGSYAPGHFRAEALDLLQLVADRVAVAVDRAGAYERAKDIAETLQRSLLPDQLPEIAGLELAARYLPGGVGTLVGGDWYDALPTADERLVVIMGDVMGRGAHAATVMSKLRSAGRIYVSEGCDPAEVARRLGELVGSMGEGEFATLICLEIDPRTGSASIVNAGHPPPLLRRPDGSTSFLTQALGPPLATSDEPYQKIAVDIPMGSLIVLYTDGLIEQRNRTLQEGLARLDNAVAELPDTASCDQIIDATVDRGAPHDDIAVLTVRLTASPTDPLSATYAITPDVLTEMRTTLRAWLSRAGVGAEQAEDLVVAAGEAATNVVKHAYPEGTGHLDLNVHRVGATITIVVRDYGRWQAPATTDRGRGLLMMESLVDHLQILHHTDGTAVRLHANVRT